MSLIQSAKVSLRYAGYLDFQGFSIRFDPPKPNGTRKMTDSLEELLKKNQCLQIQTRFHRDLPKKERNTIILSNSLFVNSIEPKTSLKKFGILGSIHTFIKMSTQNNYSYIKILSEMFHFFLHPTKQFPEIKNQKALQIVPKLFLIMIIIHIWTGFIIQLILPEQEKTADNTIFSQWELSEKIFGDTPEILFIALGIGMVVLFFPILEELVFRLALKPGKRNVFGLLAALLYGSFLIDPDYNAPILLFIALGTAFIIFLYREIETEIVTKVYDKALPGLIYLSSFLFGMIHIQNHTSSIALSASFLYMFPYFCIGLFLAFVRIRFGFKYAVLLHILRNLLATISFILFILIANHL